MLNTISTSANGLALAICAQSLREQASGRTVSGETGELICVSILNQRVYTAAAARMRKPASPNILN